MTAEKRAAVLMELWIRYEPQKFYGPQITAEEARYPTTLGTGAGYGNPKDPYGRGVKWGKQKSFNDYRGAL